MQSFPLDFLTKAHDFKITYASFLIYRPQAISRPREVLSERSPGRGRRAVEMKIEEWTLLMWTPGFIS